MCVCGKSAVSARSSVHSQGVLRAGSFLKALLMDWPDIPSKWSTLSVNSLSDKDPPFLPSLSISLLPDMKYTRKGRWAQNPLSVSGRVGKWTRVKKNQLDTHSCVSGVEWGECIVENGWRLSLYPPTASTDWPSVWGGNWSLSDSFVATARVIARIWPLAGIAVKAVTTSELGSMATHIQHVHTQTGAHTRAAACLIHIQHTYTNKWGACTHRRANSIQIMEVCCIR